MVESNEEYENWKKNTPFLYNALLTHVLEWPSLSVEILPQREDALLNPSNDESPLSLLIGTHTSEKEKNCVLLLDVFVPMKNSVIDKQFLLYDDYSGFGFGSLQNKFHIRDVLPHPLGEPNRIRTMPQNCCIIASISSSGSVKVMNLPSFQYPNLSEDIERTYVHLIGHQQEGWALDWSSTETGRLATGSDDMLICTWDLQGQPLKPSCQPLEQRTQSSLYPTLTLRGHKAAVQDVAWHPIERNLLFSSGDDGTYKIWDIRSSSSPQIDNLTAGGGKPLNSIAVNKYHPELFATGGEEQDVVLWDTRNPSEEVYRLSYGHTSCISRIAWGNSERYLASCAGDRLVLVWDLYSIGKETTLNESEDGPPELLFTHAGHTDCVYDFSWNPNETEAVMLASVSQDNELHVWKMEDEVLESDELYSTDDDEFEVE